MSQRPFFSIAIPSKNRPDQVRQAVQSVLNQTFPDVEVIVCDNSDPAEAVVAEAAVRAFGDPRVVYVRTNGRLSMPDNWERAVAEARGDFVGILTDRSVLRASALERAHGHIVATGVPLVAWFSDSYGRGPTRREFRRRPRSGRAWLVESQRLLQYFLHGPAKYASKFVPKLMTSVCSREVIERARASAVGRICPPVCPDYTSGYLMLAHTEQLVLIDDGLFVSCGSGNGSSFRRRGALADRFMHDLGMTWRDLVDRMPTRACFTSALVLNDLMRLKAQVPERFAGCEIDRARYYLGCLTDYDRSARRGADLFEDYDELLEGLNLESEQVQAAVRSSNAYIRAATVLPPEGVDDGQIDGQADDDDGGGGFVHPQFETVFDAMAEADRHPHPHERAAAVTDDVIDMPALTRQNLERLLRNKRAVRGRSFAVSASMEQR